MSPRHRVFTKNGNTYTWSCERPFENYSWDDIPLFDPAWLPQVPESSQTKHDFGLSQLKVPRTARTERRIDGLIRYLDQPVADRSKRDFSVVMGLLRLHVPADEVARLVEGHSKFRQNPKYLEATLRNALKAMEYDTTRTG